MKTNLNRIKSALKAAFAMAFLGLATTAFSQDNIIAIGKINTLGNVVSSSNTVEGVVNSSKNGTGDYTVTVTAPGEFIGLDSNDFAIETTINSTASGDETIKSTVIGVSDDVLTFTVNSDEVEDATNPFGPEERDVHFFFAVYRIQQENSVSNASNYVISNGLVNSNGSLAASIGISGITVLSVKDSPGNYRVILTKTGGFNGDSSNDYVLSLSAHGANDQDQAIRGGVQSTVSDDQVVFNIHTDDVQDNANNNLTTPSDNKFSFTIYRIPSGSATSTSDTNLLVALARVSSVGTLLSTPNSTDGGILSAAIDGAGDYRVTIVSPGAFAGKVANDFVPQVFLNQGNSADEGINCTVTISNVNTLVVNVNTNDLEADTEAMGVPTNAGFFLVLMDAVGDFQPDLRIGAKKNLSQMKGNDKYNGNGNGQQLTKKLPGTSKKKFFFALENDGNIIDQVNLREVGAGSKIRTKYFRTTGGRKNVTAKVTKIGLLEDRLTPDKLVRFEGSAKYKRLDKRPRKKIRLKAISQILGSKKDTNRLQVKPQ